MREWRKRNRERERDEKSVSFSGDQSRWEQASDASSFLPRLRLALVWPLLLPQQPLFFLSFLSPRASETHTPRKTEQNKTNKNSSGASSVSVRPSAAVAPRASIPPALPRRRRSGGGNNSLLVARAEDEKKEGGGDFYNDERPVSFSLLLFSCFLSTFCPESVSKEEKDAAVYSFAHLRFSH